MGIETNALAFCTTVPVFLKKSCHEYFGYYANKLQFREDFKKNSKKNDIVQKGGEVSDLYP